VHTKNQLASKCVKETLSIETINLICSLVAIVVLVAIGASVKSAFL